ncbi:MAG TPA: hypothetical protein DC042_10565 [Bacteroidales bacterium]|nr:hypothetical protein [Bacteroidales bacterium]
MKKIVFFLALLLTSLILSAQDGSIQFKGGRGKHFSLDFNIKGITDPDPVDNRIIPIFMIVMAAGILLVWMLEVANGKFKDQGSLPEWKSEGGDLIWLHLLAEFTTAGILLAGGIGLLGQNGWGYKLGLVALGALAYTSLNSLAWSFAQKSRLGYAIPMGIGFAGAVAAVVLLLS